MTDPERHVPDDSLRFIRHCVEDGKILWTYHVQMRLRGRSISKETILALVASFEIIEAYPEDKYFPSYLVYSRQGDEVFHILFATDVAGDNVRVITAYRQNLTEWAEDLKTRRK